MILLEEDIQQLRIVKTKGTGEQTFNLFSTSIAAFKGVSWQNIKSKTPFLIQHVAFILLSKIAPRGIMIYKLSLFSTLIHGEIHSLKEEGAWWVRGKGGGGEGGRGRPVKKAAGFCY